jgi:hypothetical protein
MGKNLRFWMGVLSLAVVGTTFADDHPAGLASSGSPAHSRHYRKHHHYKEPVLIPTLPNHEHPDSHSN